MGGYSFTKPPYWLCVSPSAPRNAKTLGLRWAGFSAGAPCGGYHYVAHWVCQIATNLCAHLIETCFQLTIPDISPKIPPCMFATMGIRAERFYRGGEQIFFLTLSLSRLYVFEEIRGVTPRHIHHLSDGYLLELSLTFRM